MKKVASLCCIVSVFIAGLATGLNSKSEPLPRLASEVVAADSFPIEREFLAASSKVNELGIMVNEEHRRPPLQPRVLAPSATRTLVVALGTGHPAPNPNRFGPATAIIVDETAYFVDAGEGIWRAAAKAASIHGGRVAEALDLTSKPTKVFLTHLHSDHTVGLPSLMLSPWSYGKKVPLEVYGPPGTKDMVSNLLEAYRLDIENRVGRSSNDLGWRTVAHDFDIESIVANNQGLVYMDDLVRIEAFQTTHANWARS